MRIAVFEGEKARLFALLLGVSAFEEGILFMGMDASIPRGCGRETACLRRVKGGSEGGKGKKYVKNGVIWTNFMKIASRSIKLVAFLMIFVI
jgi:hypothetical protein